MKNEDLFTISEAATALDITPRTLRWHEQKGLLSPREKNENTGYRYYDALNLQEILLLLLLCDAGMTLDEINLFIHKALTPKEQNQLLDAKIKSLELTIDMLKMHRTETGQYAPKQVTLPKRYCFCKSFIAPDIASFIPIYHACVAEIIRRGLVLSREYPVFCEYPAEAFLENELNLKDFPVKICVPVKTKKPCEDIKLYPEQNAVSVVVRGAYENLWQGYKAAYAYIAEQKLRQDGNPQEIYFESIDAGLEKDQYLTQVIIPVGR